MWRVSRCNTNSHANTCHAGKIAKTKKHKIWKQTLVLFSLGQEPRIGKVLDLRSSDNRPIVVHLWKPHRRVKDFISARYAPHFDGEDPSLHTITPVRIRLDDLEVDDRGFFLPGSRRKLTRCLRAWKKLPWLFLFLFRFCRRDMHPPCVRRPALHFHRTQGNRKGRRTRLEEVMWSMRISSHCEVSKNRHNFVF